jgi:energy-coupling factor transporter ATP-binding protein EcfA2
MGHQPDKAIHYMEEAQALADHVCVMSKGEIAATGTQEAWRAEADVGGEKAAGGGDDVGAGLDFAGAVAAGAHEFAERLSGVALDPAAASDGGHHGEVS